ncbi:hypothetical protein Poly30_31890 [Planctomycetes bacterium Poly30]|uniref:FHA domain-containing protein n=1 Tax=Saltatorellus ferox TaxID=2528018 RepID=A0A518EUB5_9BACT|nr:hypothetical protein Poly30_31890 [Planctomycetes bacterium Poly30]
MTETLSPRRPLRLLLSIDDVGDVLLLIGTSVVVGHTAAPEPDLRFLGDLDGVHGQFRLRDSFHGGAEWALAVQPGAAPIEIDGSSLRSSDGPRSVHDGDRVRFGVAASFTCRLSDPSSATMVLELEGPTDADGARRVALMAPGVAGRLRFGPRRRRQIVVPGIAHDVALVAQLEGPGSPSLAVSCSGGVRAPRGEPQQAVALALPLEKRIDLALGAAPDRRPPFGMAIRQA